MVAKKPTRKASPEAAPAVAEAPLIAHACPDPLVAEMSKTGMGLISAFHERFARLEEAVTNKRDPHSIPVMSLEAFGERIAELSGVKVERE